MTEMEWMDSFSRNLSSLIQEAYMSRREVADECGLSESTLSRYTSRDPEAWRMPTARAILNLSYVLDCELEDLIDFGEQID